MQVLQMCCADGLLIARYGRLKATHGQYQFLANKLSTGVHCTAFINLPVIASRSTMMFVVVACRSAHEYMSCQA